MTDASLTTIIGRDKDLRGFRVFVEGIGRSGAALVVRDTAAPTATAAAPPDLPELLVTGVTFRARLAHALRRGTGERPARP